MNIDERVMGVVAAEDYYDNEQELNICSLSDSVPLASPHLLRFASLVTAIMVSAKERYLEATKKRNVDSCPTTSRWESCDPGHDSVGRLREQFAQTPPVDVGADAGPTQAQLRAG